MANRTQRSLSYNDLKRRRCLRSSKSQDKIKRSLAVSTAIQSQNKPKHEKMTVHEKLQLCFSERKHQIPNQNNWYSHSERQAYSSLRKNKSLRKVGGADRQNSSYLNIFSERIETFDSKEILRSLMKKGKSKKKILTLRELRNQIKEEKQKSRSKSRCDETLTPRKSHDTPSHKLRIKKFETIPENHRNKSKRKLIEISTGKHEGQVQNFPFDLQHRSGKERQIAKRKQIVQEKQTIQRVTKHKQRNSKKDANILDLLEARDNQQVAQLLKRDSTNKKKEKVLHKFKKMFPEGFMSFQ